MTQYGFINPAAYEKPASDIILAKQLWERLIGLYKKDVPEMKTADEALQQNYLIGSAMA